jgi:outer membrane protein assembly factor BamB
MANRFRPLVVVAMLSFLCWPAFCARADWPGLLGAQRDGFTSTATILADHSKAPAKIRWEIDAGQGYAGAAIAENLVVLFFRDGEQDVVQAVSLDKGNTIWKTSFPATYQQGIDRDTGPRSVPQIAQGKVFTYSAAGTLHCVDLQDGRKLWSRELRKDYGAEDGYFGAGNSPLIVDKSAIVNVGGRKKGGVVAISIADGKTLWAATDADASYASPILWKQDLVVPTRLATYGLNPADGSVRWQIPFGQRGPTVNAATPIITQEDQLFLTSSYGIGFVMAKRSAGSIEVVQKGDSISSQYATPICVGPSLFGSDGREDGGETDFRCIDGKTGATLWTKSGMPICHTIGIRSEAANSRENPKEKPGANLLLVGINGKLWYLPASRDGFKPVWSTQLPEGKYRALPAMSKNLLVVRTSGGSNAKWRCFEL